MHLVVDGHGADAEKLGDTDLVYRFLDEHPSVIGMTKIVPPQVYTYHGQTAQDWGVSGFVIIAESHISVHTFPDRGYLNIDIFSCKDFDAESSLKDVKRVFGLMQVRVWELQRGIEYATTRQGYSGMVRERVGISHSVTTVTVSSDNSISMSIKTQGETSSASASTSVDAENSGAQ